MKVSTAAPDRELSLRRLLEYYPHTRLLPEGAARDPAYLKRALAGPLADAAARQAAWLR